jgi:hypothetical protein
MTGSAKQSMGLGKNGLLPPSLVSYGGQVVASLLAQTLRVVAGNDEKSGIMAQTPQAVFVIVLVESGAPKERPQLRGTSRGQVFCQIVPGTGTITERVAAIAVPVAPCDEPHGTIKRPKAELMILNAEAASVGGRFQFPPRGLRFSDNLNALPPHNS